MTDQAAASPEAKPTDRGPLTMEQAVAQSLERYRSAQAPTAAPKAEDAAPAEANPEQVEPEEADSVDEVETEATDEQTAPQKVNDGRTVKDMVIGVTWIFMHNSAIGFVSAEGGYGE